MSSQFQTDSLFEILLQAILLLQSFNKVFYFIRIYEPFSFMLTMSFLIVKEIVPFLALCLIIMVALTKQYTVMHLGITVESEYLGIQSMFLKLMIQVYKSNSGDVNVPVLDADMLSRINESVLYGNIIFLFNIIIWVAQQCIFIFLGATFLS